MPGTGTGAGDNRRQDRIHFEGKGRISPPHLLNKTGLLDPDQCRKRGLCQELDPFPWIDSSDLVFKFKGHKLKVSIHCQLRSNFQIQAHEPVALGLCPQVSAMCPPSALPGGVEVYSSGEGHTTDEHCPHGAWGCQTYGQSW